MSLRYGMRTLFVVMTIMALGLGWLGKRYRDKRHELIVVQRLIDQGAVVGFDYGNGAGKPGKATWLSKLLGDEFFARVDQVICSSLDDERMEAFRDLPSVTTIDASGSHITDRGLEDFRGRASITFLNLDGTAVTDAGMPVLRTLSGLASIYLFDTAVTGQGLASLSGLQNLRTVGISQNQLATGLVLSNLPKLNDLPPILGGRVDLEDLGGGAEPDLSLEIYRAESIRLVRLPRLKELRIVEAPAKVYLEDLDHLKDVECVGDVDLDTALEQLAKLPSIETLNLRSGRITARGAALLGNMKRLIELDMMGTKIGDEIAPHLGKLTELTRLDLTFTQITDKSLVHLKGLLRLETLDVGGTLVSKEGVESIERALPDTNVQWAWAQ